MQFLFYVLFVVLLLSNGLELVPHSNYNFTIKNELKLLPKITKSKFNASNILDDLLNDYNPMIKPSRSCISL